MNQRNRIKKRKRCESLGFFSKHVLGFKDVNKKTHGGILSALEDTDAKRKLICVPRGSLKSSLACVAYPLFLLLRDPNLRILLDSELYTNSSTFLREIKLHLKAREFTELFGDWEGDVWSQGEIIVSKRTKRLKEASITCGGIGTTKVGQHFDVIIHDDMNSPSNSNTPENAAKVVEHYRYNVSILEPTGTMVVIGTRYSASDLISHILTNECGLKEPFEVGAYSA